MQYAWLYPIASAFAVALFGYLVVVRKTSGRIISTEAEDLWEEARNLREVYQAEIARLRARIAELEAKLDAESAHYEATIDELRATILELRSERLDLLKRVERMENGS